MKRRKPLAIGLIVLIAALAGGATWRYATYWPKRFAAVEPGRLYRSGEVSAAQLARVRDELGVRRIVCLLDANAPVTHTERAAAEQLGLTWCNVSLTGDGASTPADREQIVAWLTDPDAPPTLVHCAAGVTRTGLAVGLYRLYGQGWTLEQVMAELRGTDFEDAPHHENLRQALATEAQRAAQRRAAAGG